MGTGGVEFPTNLFRINVIGITFLQFIQLQKRIGRRI